MKRPIQILVVLLLVSIAAEPAIRRIPWDPTDRPRMQLLRAMQIAHDALNMQEGLSKSDEKFYCIDAVLAVTSSKDGDWTFTFGSKQSGRRWAIVDFDGRVTVSKGPPLY
jgi:hypothetical protein